MKTLNIFYLVIYCWGKQWQTTPKNLPRMQRTRAIPVAWLSSGLCPNRPKGWIPTIIYCTHKVHNDIIFLRSLHCVPYKCSSASEVHGYESFWLRVQPLVHRLLHLFVGPERLASHRFFEWSKKRENHLGRGLASTADVEDTRRTSCIVATVEWAVWGRALSCCNKTPIFRNPRRSDLIAGRRWFLRRSAYVALVTVFFLGT